MNINMTERLSYANAVWNWLVLRQRQAVLKAADLDEKLVRRPLADDYLKEDKKNIIQILTEEGSRSLEKLEGLISVLCYMGKEVFFF